MDLPTPSRHTIHYTRSHNHHTYTHTATQTQTPTHYAYVPQQVVGLNCLVHVLHVDADGHAHQHVLGTLNHLAVQPQQVGALQGLRGVVGGVGCRWEEETQGKFGDLVVWQHGRQGCGLG